MRNRHLANNRIIESKPNSSENNRRIIGVSVAIPDNTNITFLLNNIPIFPSKLLIPP